jgi:hypothetical protein
MDERDNTFVVGRIVTRGIKDKYSRNVVTRRDVMMRQDGYPRDEVDRTKAKSLRHLNNEVSSIVTVSNYGLPSGASISEWSYVACVDIAGVTYVGLNWQNCLASTWSRCGDANWVFYYSIVNNSMSFFFYFFAFRLALLSVFRSIQSFAFEFCIASCDILVDG